MHRIHWSNAIRHLPTLLAWAVLSLGAAGTARADDTILRVEEDWSLLVNHPDPIVAAPQVSTQMIRWPWSSRYANFHINSCDLPSYQQGGMQLQTWKGSTNFAVATSSTRPVMGTPNELITWTQYLRKDTNLGVLKFGISAASSTTFGNFSGIEVSLPSGSTDLNWYTPSYSQQNSGVTFGANRVTSFTLVRVRKYYDDGRVVTDETPRVVFAQALDPNLNQ